MPSLSPTEPSLQAGDKAARGRPRSARRRTRLIIAATIAAIAVIGGLTGLLLSSHGSSSDSATPALAMPHSGGGLTRMSPDPGASGMVPTGTDQPGAQGAQYADYELSGTSTAFANLYLVPLVSSPQDSTLYKQQGAKSTLAIRTSGYTQVVSETPVHPDGAMSCMVLSAAGAPQQLCMWMDGTEIGTLTFDSPLTDPQAAAYATALWEASEH